MQAIKTAIVSPDCLINKNYAQLKAHVDKQEEILVKQQQFLEALDQKEGEASIVVLGVPDENEALDGATTDQEKLNKIWNKVGVRGVEDTHLPLGRRINATEEPSHPVNALGQGPAHEYP